MPTPGERRALLFIASVAALGVAVRGWREFRPPDSPVLAGNRAALARQIEAVDSAISVTSSRRKPHDARVLRSPGPDAAGTAPARTIRPDMPRAAPAPRPLRSRGRLPVPSDTQPPDPRQAYWDRSAYFDSVRLASVRPTPAGRDKPRDFASSQSGNHQRLGLKSGPPIDLDIAGMDEVAALTLVGPALARRIVMNRIESGPFGSITGLQRVSGITAAFARRLEPFVTFSGSPRLGSAGERPPRSKNERLPRREARP